MKNVNQLELTKEEFKQILKWAMIGRQVEGLQYEFKPEMRDIHAITHNMLSQAHKFDCMDLVHDEGGHWIPSDYLSSQIDKALESYFELIAEDELVELGSGE